MVTGQPDIGIDLKVNMDFCNENNVEHTQLVYKLNPAFYFFSCNLRVSSITLKGKVFTGRLGIQSK